jgi:hypothetical protein
VKIKGERSLAKKWARRVAASTRHYASGVKNPRTGTPPKHVKGVKKLAAAAASAQSKWARGWAPYREVLLRLELPPRGPMRSPQNIQRVQAVCDALHRKKLELMGMDTPQTAKRRERGKRAHYRKVRQSMGQVVQ